MKLKTLTCVSSINNEGLHKLEASLKLFNHDYQVIHNPNIGWDWSGYTEVYNWCKQNLNNYTHLIYTDGFDTLALTDQSECMEAIKTICGENTDRMIYSVEKNFFPFEEWGQVNPYPSTLFTDELLNLTPNHRWRFCNGGQYCASLQSLIWWYDLAPKHLVNQYWANKYFTSQNQDKRLVFDFNCNLFQSVAFSGKAHNGMDEFNYESVKEDKRVINKLLGTKPCFAHGNGMKGDDFKQNFQFVYDCINY